MTRNTTRLLFVLMLSIPCRVSAQEARPAWSSIRLSPPFVGFVEYINPGDDQIRNDLRGLAGIGIAHQFSNRVTLETGIQGTVGWKTSIGSAMYARGGYAIALHGEADPKAGWIRGFLTPLLGYRYARIAGNTTEPNSYDVSHNLHAALAYDLHLGRKYAFNLRLLPAVDVAIVRNVQERDFRFGRAKEVSVQLGFELGFATSLFSGD